MPKYLIERNVRGAHEMTHDDRRAGARKSCEVLAALGTGIQWQQSFITRDRITCIYIANDEEVIRRHAELSGFPADAIREIVEGMDPTTAEAN